MDQTSPNSFQRFLDLKSVLTVRSSLFVARHTQDLAVGKRVGATSGNRSFVMGFPSVRAVVVSAKVKHKPLGASACVAVSVRGAFALTSAAGSLPCLPYC